MGSNGSRVTSRNPEMKADSLSRFKSEESRARSLANLKPWAKGTAPKSPGRTPRSHPLLRELDKALRSRLPIDEQKRTFYRLICEALVRKAAKGDAECARIIFDRCIGRVREPEEMDRPSQIFVVVNRNQPRVFGSVETDPELKNS